LLFAFSLGVSFLFFFLTWSCYTAQAGLAGITGAHHCAGVTTSIFIFIYYLFI
jgi:DMSO/TMAO reductase YedYZ heme-binding membrane subunit